MNLRSTTLAAVIVSSGLITALPAEAGPNSLLNGDYTGSLTKICLAAAGGFNSDLEPNVVSNAYINPSSEEAVWTFDGAGSVVLDKTSIGNSSAASASSTLTPDAFGARGINTLKYKIGAGGAVTVTGTNLKITYFAGKRSGQTSIVDKFVLTGYVSSDGKTVTLATPAARLETRTYSNGDVVQEICHRAVVLLKQ